MCAMLQHVMRTQLCECDTANMLRGWIYTLLATCAPLAYLCRIVAVQNLSASAVVYPPSATLHQGPLWRNVGLPI